jgi:putative ABC transport system permease protein
MNNTLQIIPLTNLVFSFLPVLVVVFILYKWRMEYRNSLYAISRMLVQLLAIGYFLAYLFESESGMFISLVLAVMLIASSLIALRTAGQLRKSLFSRALVSITLGGGLMLVLVTQGVLELSPWYSPRFLIPLAGMIFANALNSISLAIERLISELDRGVIYQEARNIAFRASLIPITNSLFAVGLVSLPGMMTGQILSGVSPLIAVRYQVMVMTMVFGAAGISAATFLTLIERKMVLCYQNGAIQE